MELIYSFTVALFLTIALIPLLIRFSGQLQLLDDPSDARKVHTTAIPRSGGLAIAIGVFLPLIFLLPMGAAFKGLFAGSLIIVVFGVCDDRCELSYKWKFVGQIAAVLAAMGGGISIDQLPFMGLEPGPNWLVYPLTFFFLLGVTNAVNLTDGLDGLAAGTTLVSLVLITVFALVADYQSAALVAITIAGGVLGFLRFNTFPARIFMGDTGSQFLGFTAACLAVMVSQYPSAAYSPVIPLLIMGLPILDTLMVMTIRLREKRSPFSPDKNHLHHQLMKLGFRHYEAVAVIYLAQIVLVCSAYLFCYANDELLVAVYLLFCGGLLSLIYGARKSGWQLRSQLPSDQICERRNRLLRRLEWLYSNTGNVVEWLVAAILLLMTVAISREEVATGSASLALATVLAVVSVILKKHPGFVVRASMYCCAVYLLYLLSLVAVAQPFEYAVNASLFALALLLMLAIRMTRREEFRLDTQDLLILLMIVVVPQLPFAALDQLSVGQIVIRLAVLLYACEFILAKNHSRFRVINFTAIAALLLLAW